MLVNAPIEAPVESVPELCRMAEGVTEIIIPATHPRAMNPLKSSSAPLGKTVMVVQHTIDRNKRG